MPGEPFNVLNDDGDASVAKQPAAQPPLPPPPPARGAKYGAPGVGHVFEDGFTIPGDLSGGPGIMSMSEEDPELDDELGELDLGDSGGPPGPPMPRGGPGVPGFDGSLSRTPFDAANDPNTPVIPPATSETFVCMVGPCRHYLEMQLGVDRPKDDPFDRPDLWRVCRHLHDNDGEVSLKDANVPLCSGYAPPWWSIAGQRKKLEVRARLDRINGREAPVGLRLLGRVDRASRHIKAAANALRGVEEEGNGTGSR